MIICLVIAIVAVWYGFSEGSMADQNWVRPNCVEEAIACAKAWQRITGEDVEIEITKTDPVNNIDHAQARAKHRGQWTYLTLGYDANSGCNICRPNPRHFPEHEPYRHVDLRTFVKEQIGD